MIDRDHDLPVTKQADVVGIARTQQRPVIVFPLANTGTVVSSPCNRSAVYT